MPVKAIRAVIECERCGIEFSVEIEASVPEKWSMWDVAKDAVRGSLDYECCPSPGSGRVAGLLGRVSSVQHDQMLCADCTQAVDREEDPGGTA